jgi:hypothetical protein
MHFLSITHKANYDIAMPGVWPEISKKNHKAYTDMCDDPDVIRNAFKMYFCV